MASIIVGWLQSRHCLGCVANTRTHACTLTHIHTKWLDRVFFFSCSYSSSTRLFFHIASQLNGLSNCFLSLKKSLGSNDVFVVVFFSYKIPQCGMQRMICWNKTFLSPRSIFNRTYSATCGQQQHIYFKDRYRTEQWLFKSSIESECGAMTALDWKPNHILQTKNRISWSLKTHIEDETEEI